LAVSATVFEIFTVKDRKLLICWRVIIRYS